MATVTKATLLHSPTANSAPASAVCHDSLSSSPNAGGPNQDGLLNVRQEGVLRNLNQMQGALEAIEGQYRRIAKPLRSELSALDHIVNLMANNENLVYDGPYEKEIANLVILRKLCEHAKSKIAQIQKEAAELSIEVVPFNNVSDPRSIAVGKLKRFHAAIAQDPKSMKQHWEDMLQGSNLQREAGVLAQQRLMQGISLLRACLDKSKKLMSKNDVNYENTVGLNDAILFEALRRLTTNNLMLFPDQKDRNALANLSRTLSHYEEHDGFLDIESIRLACEPLEKESKAIVQLLTNVIHLPHYFRDLAEELNLFENHAAFSNDSPDSSDRKSN